MLLPQRSTLVPYTTLFRSPGARQAHCLRAAGGVVGNAYCRAPRARRRGGERHRKGAGPIDGQGGGEIGRASCRERVYVVVGGLRVTAEGVAERAAGGQGRG